MVDDHGMVRQGLRTRLELHRDMQVVGEAGDGEAALKAVRDLRPDIVVPAPSTSEAASRRAWWIPRSEIRRSSDTGSGRPPVEVKASRVHSSTGVGVPRVANASRGGSSLPTRARSSRAGESTPSGPEAAAARQPCSVLRPVPWTSNQALRTRCSHSLRHLVHLRQAQPLVVELCQAA